MSTGVRQKHKRGCAAPKSGCRCPWAWAYGKGDDYRTGTGFANQRTAQAARANYLASRQAGVLTPKTTFRQYGQAWLERKSTTLSATTLRGYRDHLDRVWEPLHDVKLADVTPSQIERALKASREKYPTLGPTACKRAVATLNSMLNEAVKRRELAFNPAATVSTPRYRVRKVQPWSPVQFGSFLASEEVKADRVRIAWELAGFGGLRRGELCGLRWKDIDLASGIVTVAINRVQVGHEVVKSTVKTDAGQDRLVHLDAVTLRALKGHQKRQKAERLAAGPAWVNSGYVLVSPDGSPLHPELLSKAFLRSVRASGLPHQRLHDLRHLSASLQLAAGVPLAVISKRLGHSSTSITGSLYSHLIGGVGQQAAEAAAALVPRQT